MRSAEGSCIKDTGALILERVTGLKGAFSGSSSLYASSVHSHILNPACFACFLSTFATYSSPKCVSTTLILIISEHRVNMNEHK